MASHFRFSAKKAFLTYAHCPHAPEEFLHLFTDKIPVYRYIIATEKHADGSDHIHAYLEFESKVDTRSPQVFDIGIYHPNIKTISGSRAIENVKAYAQKGGNFITNFPEKISKLASLAKTVIQDGLNAKTLKENPELLFKNFASIQSWMSLLPKRPSHYQSLPKKRHLWVSGPSNSGKSTFLNAFKECFEHAVEIPINSDWRYVREDTDLFWADEFKGHLTITDLNRLCDGNKHFNTKGGSVILPMGWVIIVSNYTFEEVYASAIEKDREILNMFYNRFTCYIAPSFPKFPTREL